jgi:methylthioribose-1-phosphate isomerase
MQHGEVDLIIVGADRIAANGDAANKIGTYMKALAAQAHAVPFYIAAPTSTVDAACESGAGIPIEARDADEVRRVAGLDDRSRPASVRIASADCANPAFDVTPAALITAIITEQGIVPARDIAGVKDGR